MSRGMSPGAQRYHRLKAAGLCVTCGRTEAAPDYTQCAPCLDETRAYNRAIRDAANSLAKARAVIPSRPVLTEAAERLLNSITGAARIR